MSTRPPVTSATPLLISRRKAFVHLATPRQILQIARQMTTMMRNSQSDGTWPMRAYHLGSKGCRCPPPPDPIASLKRMISAPP
jgi:hypothetical protein